MEWNEMESVINISVSGLYTFLDGTDTQLDGTGRDGTALPQQFIRQPPPRPLGMPVFLVPHFIETPPCLRIGKSSGANIGREIIHSTRANTRDFTRLSIHVDFLIRDRGRFYNDAEFARHFSRIIRYGIRLHHARGVYIYILYIHN